MHSILKNQSAFANILHEYINLTLTNTVLTANIMMRLLYASVLTSIELSHATPNPPGSPTLSIDDYPTDIEISGYGSSFHYWYNGEQYNGRRLWTTDSGNRDLWWTGGEWWISLWAGGGYFTRCWEYNLFECTNDFTVKYCINADQSEDEYIINGTYNGRWMFQAKNIDRYIYYYLEDASWKIADKDRNNIYATCDNQNIFSCRTGIEFSTCETRAPTQEPTNEPTTTGTMYNF